MLDHRVVELARRMPVDLKWRGRCCRLPLGKAVLRDGLAARPGVRSLFANAPGRPPSSAPREHTRGAVTGTFGDDWGGALPPRILARGKMGFGVPVSDWLAGPQAEWMRGILLDRATLARGVLERSGVERLVRDHTSRAADHGERLWALVCLELWFRAFID